ncbi:MAG: hypothetical protein ACOXZJ_04340 [Bacteroidales bacterium]
MAPWTAYPPVWTLCTLLTFNMPALRLRPLMVVTLWLLPVRNGREMTMETLILDKNGMPTYTTSLSEVGNREAVFSGGFNNTFTWKNLSFNMLWEFRVGGDVINGTRYAMDVCRCQQILR